MSAPVPEAEKFVTMSIKEAEVWVISLANEPQIACLTDTAAQYYVDKLLMLADSEGVTLGELTITRIGVE